MTKKAKNPPAGNPLVKDALPLPDMLNNPAQAGGIETSVADNGPARGNRIAWINTGSGLRFKVVIDRAMDIYDAFYNRYALAWISHPGPTAPNPHAHTDLEWLRSFGGGLLLTCGLSHVGPPESDEYGKRGLHGRISNLPAELVSVVQPDLQSGQHEMSITGITRESKVFGPALEIRRTISCMLGEPKIRIRDRVRNAGNQAVPHMILYHCNFGWPLADEGTSILWKGSWESRGSGQDDAIFNEKHDFRTCPAPLPSHTGTGEACGFIDAQTDADGMTVCGLYNPKLKLGFFIRYKKEQLPCLANWQHWGKGEYVTGLEPGTHTPMGQQAARRAGTLIHIEPGEVRTCELEMEVTGGPAGFS